MLMSGITLHLKERDAYIMSDFEVVSAPSSPRSCSGSSSSTHSTGTGTAASNPVDHSSMSPATATAHTAEHPAAQAEPSTSTITGNMRVIFKPKLDIRPISTPINVLVCGASSTGKTSFIRMCAEMLSAATASPAACPAASPAAFPAALRAASPAAAQLSSAPNSSAKSFGTAAGSGSGAAKLPCPAAVASGISQAVDPHAVLLSGAGAFATVLPPILCPEACRELVYTFQDCPGHGATLHPAAYLDALVTFLLQQQEKDYQLLQGSMGGLKPPSRSLTYGFLQHSITACIYFMPPHGPSRLDLALMAGLSKHVALLPVVGKADAMTPGEAAACCQAVQRMIAEPAEFVPGLEAGAGIDVYRPSGESFAAVGGSLPLLLCTHAACMHGPHGETAAAVAGGVTAFLEVVSSNKVYGLLGRSWDQFISFSQAYEAAGRRLKTLAGTACKAAAQPLQGSTTVGKVGTSADADITPAQKNLDLAVDVFVGVTCVLFIIMTLWLSWRAGLWLFNVLVA